MLCGLIHRYEQAFGQKSNLDKTFGQDICPLYKQNLDKTSIYFRSNARLEVKHPIQVRTGFKANVSNEKYLGLLTFVGKNKSNAFGSTLYKIKGRMSNWKVKHLSQDGKETLLIFVI